MTTPLRHWRILVALIVLAWAAMLCMDRIPGLRKPGLRENRELADLPSTLPRDFAGLKVFREGLDAYLADNFPARVYLIGYLNLARYRLGYSGSTRAIVGRDGWIFYDNGSHLGSLRHANPMTEEMVRSWVTTLGERTRILKAQGIDYLVVSPPLQERVYPDKVPAWLLPSGGQADADRLQAAARQAGLDNFLALRDPLFASRKTLGNVYSRFDTHWTGLGAYAAHVEIISALEKQGQPLQVLPLSSFALRNEPSEKQVQGLAEMLGIAGLVRPDYPRYFVPAVEARMKLRYLTPKHAWQGPHVIDTGQTGKPVLLYTGDSFSRALMPFLYPHFSRVIFTHDGGEGFFREDMVAEFKPDVVILEVVESGIRYAMQPPLSPVSAPAPRSDSR